MKCGECVHVPVAIAERIGIGIGFNCCMCVYMRGLI